MTDKYDAEYEAFIDAQIELRKDKLAEPTYYRVEPDHLQAGR